MTTTTAVAPLVITGCGVVSPAGVGLGALADAMAAGSLPAEAAGQVPADPDLAGEDYPPTPLAALPGLRVEEYLGAKGVKSLDRTTRLALLASNRALAALQAPLTDEDRVRTGVVLGNTMGSVRSTTEFTRETLVRDKPYLVRANRFPSTIMNYSAGQIAIWNSLRGVNATIADGRVSGLAAFRYARNAIRQGHIDRAIVGATEELCAQTAWAWHLSGTLAPGMMIGEGAAMFMVEPLAAATAAGRAPLAELLACEVGSAGAGMRAGLIACIERALGRSGLTGDSIDTVSLGSTGIRGLGAAERDAVRSALGGVPRHQIRTPSVLGQSYSASGALQVAGLLAAWDDAPGPLALVTSVAEDGYAGCLVLRRTGRSGRD